MTNINGITILIEEWLYFMPFMEIGEPLRGYRNLHNSKRQRHPIPG